MATRRILVTGATGKQGGAVVKAILASPPTSPFEVLALTRNTSSTAAKSLSSNPKVSLLHGDLDDCSAIFTSAGGKGSIWGVFSVQLPDFKKKDQDKEERQGMALVDAAIEYGVSHFVYSSVDRGGPEKSWSEPTPIPHFISKHNIELYLKTKSEGTGMTWTILRPVAFMENLTPDVMGKGFGAMWNNMGDIKLQLIATKDIGVFAALAFASPEEYKGRAITLCGDELTQPEGNEIFLNVYARNMPRTYGIFGSFIQWMIPELGIMFRWFVEEGYKVDVAECKKMNKSLLTFESWLKEESKFIQ